MYRKHNFDYSKVQTVNTSHSLFLEPRFKLDHFFDELRTNNYIKNPPEKRTIPGEELEEVEREKKFGKKIDIDPSRIYERLMKTTFKIPKKDDAGNIMRDPQSGKPLKEEVKFNELVEKGEVVRAVNSAIRRYSVARRSGSQSNLKDAQDELMMLRQFLEKKDNKSEKEVKKLEQLNKIGVVKQTTPKPEERKEEEEEEKEEIKEPEADVINSYLKHIKVAELASGDSMDKQWLRTLRGQINASLNFILDFCLDSKRNAGFQSFRSNQGFFYAVGTLKAYLNTGKASIRRKSLNNYVLDI